MCHCFESNGPFLIWRHRWFKQLPIINLWIYIYRSKLRSYLRARPTIPLLLPTNPYTHSNNSCFFPSLHDHHCQPIPHLQLRLDDPSVTPCRACCWIPRIYPPFHDYLMPPRPRALACAPTELLHPDVHSSQGDSFSVSDMRNDLLGAQPVELSAEDRAEMATAVSRSAIPVFH